MSDVMADSRDVSPRYMVGDFKSIGFDYHQNVSFRSSEVGSC